ncbi:MAG: hypothetical protein J2P41_07015 [Blastocatellia bacterium]|nr:hypothetical protein [Blastocatellia bacterium]
MFESFSLYPFSFWIVIFLLVVGGLWAIHRISEGIGLPVLAVLGTAAVWYIGDALYNDYAHNHMEKFSSGNLAIAWWEVACFIFFLLILTPGINRFINLERYHNPSFVFTMFKAGVHNPTLSAQIEQLFRGCVAIWVVLSLLAFTRVGWDIPYYYFPFLGDKADPWGRTRVGTGFDALWSFASYFQTFLGGAFGIVAALTTRRKTLYLALLGCLTTWPYYLFDRTRNTMLATVLPGVLCWVFLRFRGNLVAKFALITLCFFATEIWFANVIYSRSQGVAITAAIKGDGYSLLRKEKTHHDGLDMFEELCWINTFIEDGTYTPNWGHRYFAELANPIPRSLWPGKPFIGIDYAIARGQGGGADDQAGVNASVSTGMIGQGVVNFGRIIGPIFAALLISIWVSILARMDLDGNQLGRVPLYLIGIVLTFNLGRDITLMTLYPFIFGAALVWLSNRRLSNQRKRMQQAYVVSQRRRRPSKGSAEDNRGLNYPPSY